MGSVGEKEYKFGRMAVIMKDIGNRTNPILKDATLMRRANYMYIN